MYTLPLNKWNEIVPDSTQQKSIQALENGEVIFLPTLSFTLNDEETKFLNPKFADPQAKNISYSAKTHKLSGAVELTDSERQELKVLLARFSEHAFNLIKSLFPHYAPHLIDGRTSFRPVEIADRKTSYRKDDKRLHVDAFPSSPNQGKRILRVFANVHPGDVDRVWRLGEPFPQVATRFLKTIPSPIPFWSSLLNFLNITKSHRTAYDHYMLHMHDQMKADDEYQRTVSQQEVRFPPQSSWIVTTDQVSHAAMSGQFVLEQTFYLPIKGMQKESLSPLRVLEAMLGKKLV